MAWTGEVVDRTNQAGTDLIVVTGDVIHGSVAMRRTDVEPLRRLRAPDRVYAIPGTRPYPVQGQPQATPTKPKTI